MTTLDYHRLACQDGRGPSLAAGLGGPAAANWSGRSSRLSTLAQRKRKRDADQESVSLSLYPTRTQEQTLLFVLRRCRHLYNSGLEQRKAFYQMRRKSLGYTQQAAELAEIKAAYPAYQDIHSQVLQDVLRRLDKAFAAFFRRIRNGEKPGYPRFQGEGRYDSFTYPQSGFALADTRGPGHNRYAVLTLSKIGDVLVRLHRPLVGQVKTVTIKRDVNHWYVTFSCEVEEEALPPVRRGGRY